MNTLYYGDNLKLPPTPRGVEAFKKAEKAKDKGPRQKRLGL
jgi:hypothetical protein